MTQMWLENKFVELDVSIRSKDQVSLYLKEKKKNSIRIKFSYILSVFFNNINYFIKR